MSALDLFALLVLGYFTGRAIAAALANIERTKPQQKTVFRARRETARSTSDGEGDNVYRIDDGRGEPASRLQYETRR